MPDGQEGRVSLALSGDVRVPSPPVRTPADDRETPLTDVAVTNEVQPVGELAEAEGQRCSEDTTVRIRTCPPVTYVQRASCSARLCAVAQDGPPARHRHATDTLLRKIYVLLDETSSSAY